MRRLSALVGTMLVLAALLATSGGATPAQSSKLHARVGPGFSISLTTDAGAPVTRLDPGTYEIEVEDESAEHNFHLLGPGVDRATEVVGMGKELWTVTLGDGLYRYVCDPHSVAMNGAFTVGDAPVTPPSTPPSNAVTPKSKLQLTAGPGLTISLKTAAGKAVRTMQTGTYTVVVRDRSKIHDAHVIAPGYNRRTTVPYVGTQTWRVRLAKTGTLRFLCDPHAAQMKGSAKIVRP